MSNKEQLQNNNAQLANLIQTLQGKAIGGGGAQADWGAAEGEAGHVLNRTHYAYAENKTVAECDGVPDDSGMISCNASYTALPSEGDVFTVVYNGVSYERSIVIEDVLGDGSYVFAILGNPAAAADRDDNGDPFCVMLMNDAMAGEMGFNTAVIPLDGATSVTLSIIGKVENVHKLDKKYLPAYDWNAGISEEGHILNRTHYFERGFVMTADNLTKEQYYYDDHWGLVRAMICKLKAGEVYIVNWNGAEYKCVCGTGSSDAYVYIGDATSQGGSGNGEPFCIGYDTSITSYSDFRVYPLDGSESVNLIIDREDAIPLDERFIPDMSKLTLLSPNGTRYQITVDDSGNLKATAAT